MKKKEMNYEALTISNYIGIILLGITIGVWYPLLGILFTGLFILIVSVGENSKPSERKWTKEDEEFMEEQRRHEVYEDWK